MGAVIMELHDKWKLVVLTNLQLTWIELHCIYDELQLCNSCNMSVNIQVYKYNEL
jgi:hypothetical protein